jgi:hypothetical protein
MQRPARQVHSQVYNLVARLRRSGFGDCRQGVGAKHLGPQQIWSRINNKKVNIPITSYEY